MVRHSTRNRRSGEIQQGFDTSTFRRCGERSSMAERQDVALVVTSSSLVVHPAEGVRLDEERALKARSGTASVLGSSPRPSSDVSVAERLQATGCNPVDRRFESGPRLKSTIPAAGQAGPVARRVRPSLARSRGHHKDRQDAIVGSLRDARVASDRSAKPRSGSHQRGFESHSLSRWVGRFNGKLSGSKPEAPGSSPGPPATDREGCTLTLPLATGGAVIISPANKHGEKSWPVKEEGKTEIAICLRWWPNWNEA